MLPNVLESFLNGFQDIFDDSWPPIQVIPRHFHLSLSPALYRRNIPRNGLKFYQTLKIWLFHRLIYFSVVHHLVIVSFLWYFQQKMRKIVNFIFIKKMTWVDQKPPKNTGKSVSKWLKTFMSIWEKINFFGHWGPRSTLVPNNRLHLEETKDFPEPITENVSRLKFF